MGRRFPRTRNRTRAVWWRVPGDVVPRGRLDAAQRARRLIESCPNIQCVGGIHRGGVSRLRLESVGTPECRRRIRPRRCPRPHSARSGDGFHSSTDDGLVAATDREAMTYARARLGPLVLRPRLRPAAPGRTLGRHGNAAAVQILGNVG
jgi:hypothetical protein